MAKPYARLEIGYFDHPKFLALNGNAIALWHEGKNYCERHQTDGAIPANALKRFRFRGQKSVSMLTTSCGDKSPGVAYAPLWERDGDGYRMHDYLEHNDTRAAIAARIEQADARKRADRERKAEWRGRQAESQRKSSGTETLVSAVTIASASALQHNTTLHNTTKNVRTDANGFRFDVAFLTLKGVYPLHRITSGPRTEQEFVRVIERAGGDPEAVFGRMLSNLATQKAGQQWQDPDMIPKLENWLNSGAWEQVHEPAERQPRVGVTFEAWSGCSSHTPPCTSQGECRERNLSALRARQAARA